jgi:hypothetical protein
VYNRYIKARTTSFQAANQKGNIQQQKRRDLWLSLGSLFAMIGGFVLFGALLPVKGLEFSNALLPQWGKWTYALTSFLFPDWQLEPGLSGPKLGVTALSLQEWQVFLLFTGICLLLLLLYILAVYRLPLIVSHRYIVYSTLLIGLACILIPMLTSQDILSYIMYARMEAIYHLNPMTTMPQALPHDVLYRYIYWKKQPSIYGPTWIIITGTLQWILSLLGLGSPVVMVIVLRVSALGAHIGSSLLIWSISGHLQTGIGYKQLQIRKRAMLAFAWNPLLLMEASINAHNDTVVLFFILLACWLLVRPSTSVLQSQIHATIMFALATALKINIILLMPGFILYLWTQRQWFRSTAVVLTVYIGILLALYAPLWQNGAILDVLSVNPGTNQNINTLAEFCADVFNALAHLLIGYNVGQQSPSPGELVTHAASMITFTFIYGLLCLRAMYGRNRLVTPLQLIRFFALTWFLYCALGSPWFWPWYTITFFGLFALLEASQAFSWRADTFLGTLTIPRAIRLFTFGVFSLYILAAQALYAFIPGFFPMRWAYLRGLVVWIVPLSVFILYTWSKRYQLKRFLVSQRLKLLRSE